MRTLSNSSAAGAQRKLGGDCEVIIARRGVASFHVVQNLQDVRPGRAVIAERPFRFRQNRQRPGQMPALARGPEAIDRARQGLHAEIETAFFIARDAVRPRMTAAKVHVVRRQIGIDLRERRGRTIDPSFGPQRDGPEDVLPPRVGTPGGAKLTRRFRHEFGGFTLLVGEIGCARLSVQNMTARERPYGAGRTARLRLPDQTDRVPGHGVSAGSREFTRQSLGLVQARGGSRGVPGRDGPPPLGQQDVFNPLAQGLSIGPGIGLRRPLPPARGERARTPRGLGGPARVRVDPLIRRPCVSGRLCEV
jgi:hypothetical protein